MKLRFRHTSPLDGCCWFFVLWWWWNNIFSSNSNNLHKIRLKFECERWILSNMSRVGQHQSADYALHVRWFASLCASKLFTGENWHIFELSSTFHTKLPSPALAVSIRDELMWTLQISVHHSVESQAILRMEESGDDGHRKAKAVLCGALSSCCSALRHLESLCADRAECWGGANKSTWMAARDKADCGDGGPHRRDCVHVHSVQAISQSLLSMAGEKSVRKLVFCVIQRTSLFSNVNAFLLRIFSP